MIDNRKWSLKPEILISLKLDEIALKFKSGVYDHVELEKVSASDSNIDDNRKYLCLWNYAR